MRALSSQICKYACLNSVDILERSLAGQAVRLHPLFRSPSADSQMLRCPSTEALSSLEDCVAT